MKRALLMYHHGLGDVIQLTPHLRHLHEKGFIVDLMCRKEVGTSHLLDECPYVGKLITIHNPWRSSLKFEHQIEINDAFFSEVSKKDKYDWAGSSNHFETLDCKIDMTSKDLNLSIDDKKLEVFIPEKADNDADDYTDRYLVRDFIFVHTHIKFHEWHTWEPWQWIQENLPDELPVFDTYDIRKNRSRIWEDINTCFALMKRAKHIVLSSSVFVHAADAMGLTIDVINYGRKDRKVWPLDQGRVLAVREEGKWIREK